MPPSRRPTKADLRRARAEEARAALARAQRRSRLIRLAAWSAAGVVLIVAVVVTIVLVNRPAGQPTATTFPTPSPVISAAGRTTSPPWGTPPDAARAVAAAGLPMLGAEGTALHIHAHLDVFANGSPVQVPAEIGIDQAQQQISPLHTHDSTGVIHIESPDKTATFTLGQFFTEWQVSLAADHIGGLTVDATHHLKVYVNGKPYTANPANLVLAAHDEIAIVYGTDAQPVTVPSSYAWTNGL
jgi:hypothetical protein